MMVASPIDDRAAGAAALLMALDRAGSSFRRFGYALFLEHQSVRWQFSARVGHCVQPSTSVGVLFRLMDSEDRQAYIGVDVLVRDHQFRVSGHATVDDPVPGGSGNQRFLRDLPEFRTADLDDCLTVLGKYTAELCAYVSILDDLGVPRTNPT
jgi:hypothetical protein